MSDRNKGRESRERRERDHANGVLREAQASERVGESEGRSPSDTDR